MKLYCVRHGTAENPEVDMERPLTEQGRQDVEKVAMTMGARGLHVDHLMHSPKLRAIQTAEIVARSLQAEHVSQCEQLLDEMNDVEPLVEMIDAWHEDTMLVGHLPFMHKLINALVLDDQHHEPIINYPPGTVVCLDRYNHDRWIISWLLSPDIVPERCL